MLQVTYRLASALHAWCGVDQMQQPHYSSKQFTQFMNELQHSIWRAHRLRRSWHDTVWNDRRCLDLLSARLCYR